MKLFAHVPTDQQLLEATRGGHSTDLGRNRCRDPAANVRRHRGMARAMFDPPTRWKIDRLLLRQNFGPQGGRSSNSAWRHTWCSKSCPRENVLLPYIRNRLFR